MRVFARVVLLAVVAACGNSGEPPGHVKPHSPTVPQSESPQPLPEMPVTGLATSSERGAALYVEYKCGLCHGAGGAGYAADFAPSLISETFAATATDEFLRVSITSGRPNTAMGAYGQVHKGPLSTDDVTALIAHIRSLRPDIAQITLQPQPSTGDVARGKVVYDTNCQRCHGDTNTRINAVQLGNPSFLPTASDEFMRYAIVNGRARTPMVAWQTVLSPTQIEDVIAYLRSWEATLAPMAPTPPVDPGQVASTAPAPESGPVAPAISGPVVINPKGKPPMFTLRENRFVSSAEVAQALKDKRRLVILDARTPADWERTRIEGAVSVPYYAYSLLDAVPNDGTFVLAYCACPHHASGEVVDELRRRGYKNTAIIDEGIVFWEKAGHPVVHGADGKGAAPAPETDPHAGHQH